MNKDWNYYVNNSDIIIFIRDLKKCEDKKNKKILLDRLIKLLSYIIYSKIKVFKKNDFYDDLLQEGRIGLIIAINNFDEKRSPNFFKYANWCIRTNINLYLKWFNKINKVKIYDLEENKTPYEYVENFENKKNLLKEINKLPKIHKKILIMRYGLKSNIKFTLKQMSPIFSLSEQRISQIELEVLKKFRNNLNYIL